MRTTARRALGGVGLLLLVGIPAMAGCSPYGDYYEDARKLPGNGGGGSGGGTPAGCIPAPSEGSGMGNGGAAGSGGIAGGGVVADSCGIFVSTSLGKDEAAGTKEAPVATLKAALGKAIESKQYRVYACAEDFVEAGVVVHDGVTMFGGLDCAQDWRWIGETRRTRLTSAAGTIPLRIGRAPGDTPERGAARMEDVDVVAASADPEVFDGTSSIAAVALGGAVALARCSLEAGDGAPGAPGEPYTLQAAGGVPGAAGGDACTASQVSGGAPLINDCGTPDDDSDDSIGGAGGLGFAGNGGTGSDGEPQLSMNGGSGAGSATLCTVGTDGAVGTAGMPGTGAHGLGTISAQGYAGVAGTEGGKGGPGQGGGGGGGARGGTGSGRCPGSTQTGGAAGGSGGSGGCSGLGGKPGQPGGASIALISLAATLSLENVTLKTGRGGEGGPGAPGQQGGSGADGGPGGTENAAQLFPGCAGGSGGKGGAGGYGGGGLGGHSIGIAYLGEAPVPDGATFALGQAGAGGPSDGESAGAAGVLAEREQF